MKNIPLLVATIVGTLAFVFGIAFFFSRSSAPQTVDLAQLSTGARHIAQSPKSPVASDSATPSAQADQALIQIVEFSDFQCRACKDSAGLKSQILAKYPGKVEFIYRHYPLISIHPNAMGAAQAAEVASSFDKFWEMHDVLFAKQEEWAELGQDQAKEKFIQYAQELKIEKDPFTALLNNDTVKNAVQSDITLGNQVKISATPTFFVNGKKVSAPEVMLTIDALLAP